MNRTKLYKLNVKHFHLASYKTIGFYRNPQEFLSENHKAHSRLPFIPRVTRSLKDWVYADTLSQK